MKYLRFLQNGNVRHGLLEKDNIIREIVGDIFNNPKNTENVYSLSEITFLPPCVPTKIIAVGLNYFDHANEFQMKIPDEPLIFMKPPSALIAHDANIIYPKMSKQLDYEAELAVIIKNKVKDIEPEDVSKNILGYTCFNDVTARDLQKKDEQWTRAKSFDTFAPIGPFISTDLNPDNLQIKLYKNGQLMQNSSTSNMIFKVDKIVSFVSKIMTLFPGDIIATGTPSGVGQLEAGDKVEVEIEGIGILKNKVFLEKE
ncbi:MAG TPA: fumarylacetoacetate hydrolase family protein [Atribacterota bacterium]|nr:fumarylacetoacetate hydrolase family protein [Atribacterota bacterium]